MHVLAIVGSPRKGHTYELVRRISDVLVERGGIDVEIVLLGEVNLRPCRGCYACQSKGEKFCPLKDDLLSLVQRMKEADGVILASPTYNSNVSSLMKSLMERLAWTAHRPQFIGKPAMLVSTASSFTGDALRALSWFSYTGFDVVAKVGWSVWPSPRVDWVRGARDERTLRRAAERLHQAMLHPRRSLSLRQVFEFYAMKTTPATDPAFFRADDAYHHDIESLGFAVAPWKKALGELAYAAMMKWLDSRLARKQRPTKPGAKSHGAVTAPSPDADSDANEP